MNLVILNEVLYGSTGKISLELSNLANKNNIISYISFPKSRLNKLELKYNGIIIGNALERYIHIKLSLATGYNGCFSKVGTKVFLEKLDEIKPNVIHLHNLHNCYINLEMLFNYIKKNNIRTIWTLHDCWSFTGQCPYFDMVGCEKWKTGCYDCPQIHAYPVSRVDRTKEMYQLKKQWFTGVEDMTIVTPSQWLADLVKQSYLKDYPIQVINNGIDLSIFKPRPSDFRKKYHCEDKVILLGVALGWGKRKGLDIFIELAHRLDGTYQIVLVGTDNQTDQSLPQNIISIHRTANQQELAELYTAADVFVNPTREENFPTVNLEALACGTPVITFDTGGSPECIDENCGRVVPKDNIGVMMEAIISMNYKDKKVSEKCIERAKVFDKDKQFLQYISLYQSDIK